MQNYFFYLHLEGGGHICRYLKYLLYIAGNWYDKVDHLTLGKPICQCSVCMNMYGKSIVTDSCLGSRSMRFYKWSAKLLFWFIVGTYGIINRFVYFSSMLGILQFTHVKIQHSVLKGLVAMRCCLGRVWA